jgi:hypothetical protein
MHSRIRMREKNVLALEWCNSTEINARSPDIPFHSWNLASVSTKARFLLSCPGLPPHITHTMRNTT